MALCIICWVLNCTNRLALKGRLVHLGCLGPRPCLLFILLSFQYYSGEKKAPVLTIFIGGNHEASNYLQELPYGGWVAPNIYYLGYAGGCSTITDNWQTCPPKKSHSNFIDPLTNRKWSCDLWYWEPRDNFKWFPLAGRNEENRLHPYRGLNLGP